MLFAVRCHPTGHPNGGGETLAAPLLVCAGPSGVISVDRDTRLGATLPGQSGKRLYLKLLLLLLVGQAY